MQTALVSKVAHAHWGFPGGVRAPIDRSVSRNLRLFHYSDKSDLTHTDPKAYGTSGAGLERKRRDAFPDTWVPRTYFGTETYEREACLGFNKYYTDVDPNRLYVVPEDPLDLFSKAQESSEKAGWSHNSPEALNRYEQEISKRYLGYIRPEAGVVVIFKKMPVKPVDESLESSSSSSRSLNLMA